jgi:Holin of 3TMs, for gene-transfer release
MNPLAIIEIGAKLLDKIIPDKDAREKAQAELFKAAQEQDFQLALGQIQLNTEEAKSDSIFVSGWRPYIGWVCGIALTYNFIIYPLMLWFIAFYGSAIKPPALFSDVLMELVLGMLGLGTLRTFEKWKGVTK